MEDKRIIIEKRLSDHMAFLAGRREIFGCGSSIAAAIGDMITAHRKDFDIDIDYPSIEGADLK